MATLTKQAFRTDHVGSLVRPACLLDARAAVRADRLSREELTEVEDDCVLDLLVRQRDIGLSIASDGAMRRETWGSVLTDAVDGFEAPKPPLAPARGDAEAAAVTVSFATRGVRGQLQPRGRLADGEARFLKTHARTPFKIALPSPARIARACWRDGLTDTAYDDRDALLADLTAIVSAELNSLAAEGPSCLQLDQGFTAYTDPARIGMLALTERDRERLLAADIAAENACLSAARGTAGVVTAIHLGLGRPDNAARATGGAYDWLAERLFDRIEADRILIAYDGDPIGGFDHLRHLPAGKIAVLGLIDSTVPTLEPRDHLLRRIEAASRHCPVDRLALGTSGGFQDAASPDVAAMTADQQWRKLDLLVDTARRVWG